MNKIIEPSFRESVDLMFNRASSLLDLAPNRFGDELVALRVGAVRLRYGNGMAAV